MNRHLHRIAIAILAGLAPVVSQACSVCIGGGPQAPEIGSEHSHGERFSLGVRQDYFAGDTLYRHTGRMENVGGEYLRQNNSSLNIGYEVTENWSVFLGLRHSAKTYRREENGVSVKRTESGLNDPVIGFSYSGKLVSEHERQLAFNLFAGASLPLGDTARTGEEVAEHLAGTPHGGAVHDHDLAMGTGEFGAVFAVALRYVEERFVSGISLNYAYRPEGDHGYDFGDPLIWDIAAGARILEGGHEKTGLELSLGMTGEHVGNDRIFGEVEEKTAQHTLYAGPRLRVTYDSSLLADFRVDMPFAAYTYGPTLISSWRARAGVTWRF